ncbi:MAG: response regulator [Burkholderiaceae bacterium]|nr:response regulator [Roseateles sp.]MBV8471582.1 response regulator [Burkholderiaceae bacterium]
MRSKGKILVLDDDRLVLATLAHGLSQAGFEVLDADNGDDAILLARQHRPGLALLDIRMEGLSGFDVAAYLRDYLQIPFMFLSAFADEKTVDKVKSLGAMAYLVKPLDIRQIAPAVEAAFASGQATQAVPKPAPGLLDSPIGASDQQAVSIATGVLMQRHGLTRQQALARLAQLALVEHRNVAEQAAQIIEALELRARPDQPD